MRYMPILPVGMHEILKSDKVQSAFILPQFWGNPLYREMYISRPWDVVIIDNAMYENPVPVPHDKLIEISESLSTYRTFIVAPEDRKNPANNGTLAANTIDQYGHRGKMWNIMSILHGKPSEISSTLDVLDQYNCVGYGIAVSCWRNGFDRTVIKTLPFGKHYFHAMGLDSITEMISLKQAGFDSVDSSLVATAAVNNIHLDMDTVIYRTGKPSDPKRVDILGNKFSKRVISKTSENIDRMNVWMAK